uniref:Uncharacterized protein n=1 Tax=Arundo donax TaxID=35708 RepID=A0A0A9AFG3_ARUDO
MTVRCISILGFCTWRCLCCEGVILRVSFFRAFFCWLSFSTRAVMASIAPLVRGLSAGWIPGCAVAARLILASAASSLSSSAICDAGSWWSDGGSISVSSCSSIHESAAWVGMYSGDAAGGLSIDGGLPILRQLWSTNWRCALLSCKSFLPLICS